MSLTVTQIIEEKVSKRLMERKDELEGKVILDISGPEGGKWTLFCEEGRVEKTEVDSPDVTIKMKDEDFIGLINGDLNAVTAMFTGKIKIDGDMMLATKLAQAIR